MHSQNKVKSAKVCKIGKTKGVILSERAGLIRNVAMAAALSVGAAAATGCLYEAEEPVGPPDATSVRIEGDSISWQAQHELGPNAGSTFLLTAQMNAEGFSVDDDSLTGATASDLDSKQIPADRVTDITFVALGTNDRHIKPNATETIIPLELSKSSVSGYLNRAMSKCFVFVGIQETPVWHTDETGPAWNAFLRSEAERVDGVYVDMDAVFDEHPEYIEPNNVHPTPAGMAAIRNIYVDAAEQCQDKIQAQVTTTDSSTPETEPPTTDTSIPVSTETTDTTTPDSTDPSTPDTTPVSVTETTSGN